MNKKFYITAAIPYVNAKPHIGHALEFVQTDVIARYHKLLGDDVLALSGGDENALKNVQAAERAGVPIKDFVDQNSQLFFELTKRLNVEFDVWQRGSDQATHFPASQLLWQLCDKNGDIYKKSYRGLYCVGCEAFYTLDELDEKGECFEHPGRKLEEIEEENYFFRLSAYQDKIKQLIESNEIKIVPETRKNEVLSFINGGLSDLSISRSNERARNWGVPVPHDNSQRIYVWFDALNIYQSGVGFGKDEERYKKWWPADVHVIGKGITRFHAVYWPAFLLSAGLSLPRKLFIHGYYTVNGQKMSKTIGNVYDPIPLLSRFGADPVRYYFLAKTPSFDDGDFSEEKFKEAYNFDLANGLGNLVARVAKLCERVEKRFDSQTITNFSLVVREGLDNFQFLQSLSDIWLRIRNLDRFIESKQPWTLEGEELWQVLNNCVSAISQIGYDLQPFMPETAGKILSAFETSHIKGVNSLFPRVN